MIDADRFIEPLSASAHTFVAGVPCSYLTPFINRVIDSPALDYVGATSEGEAVGIALGAYLAGRKTVTLCQNSGLGNMVNPLTSLNAPFRIPTLLIVTHRGEPGREDEPQHELMGHITHKLLDTIDVPHLPFPEREEDIGTTLDEALKKMENEKRPVALVMRKGSVGQEELQSSSRGRHTQATWLRTNDRPAEVSARPSRMEAIETVLARAADTTAIVATTGKTRRELYTAADREQHFYVVGGMGTASGIGLGVALNTPRRSVIVLDGDGAALMKLGTFATIGAQAPENLIHVVLDNEVHDSTGGQATVSGSTRFAQVASAASYRHVAETDSLPEFDAVLAELGKLEGPSLLHLKIQPGSISPLGRPELTPEEVKERFMDFLNKSR